MSWCLSGKRVRWPQLVVFLAVLLSTLDATNAQETTYGEVDRHLPDRFRQISRGVFSGAQPLHADHFASLRALGIDTLVSVDGAVPDVETARRFGLRYIHIPIGYD